MSKTLTQITFEFSDEEKSIAPDMGTDIAVSEEVVVEDKKVGIVNVVPKNLLVFLIHPGVNVAGGH
ncbi:MAG: hypothetical protein WDN26_07840 [Chitinophagaceae bacterium]